MTIFGDERQYEYPVMNMFDNQLSIQGVDPTMINPNLQFNRENETDSESDTIIEE